MDRREALMVLEEIGSTCKKDWVMSCIALDQPSSQISKVDSEEYQIKIHCSLDQASRRCLKPILQKYNLCIQEKEGYIILAAKQKRPSKVKKEPFDAFSLR